MTIAKVIDDLKQGTVLPEVVLELLKTIFRAWFKAHEKIDELEEQISQLQQQIAELKKKLKQEEEKLDEPFSIQAEEKRQQKRGKGGQSSSKPRRPGRRLTAEKLDLAERHLYVYPDGVPSFQCRYSHSRVVWRLIDGRAVLVAYHIYQHGWDRGQVPFVLPRSEFGLEFVLSLAHMIYHMGISFDKACELLGFLQKLPITKSQANALMNQLARAWEKEFETLCTLLAHAAVVHADETGWSLKSVWAFISDQSLVCLFGVNKDGDTLAQVLNKEVFKGTLVSDDASVYRDFTSAQKCWAHLLRKAIKLTLQDPDNGAYREFADNLLELYRKACRIKKDGRYTQATRERKVAELEDELTKICRERFEDDREPATDLEHSYLCLVRELMRLQEAKELFTFVIKSEVDGTNNEAERELRPSSQCRVTGRTNKTVTGCRRQTVICSVLGSLRKHLPDFSLQSVLEEVQRWWDDGQSCFRKLAESLDLPPPSKSVLDTLIPTPS